MIDFHTHILPNIDDGARNIDETIALIKEAKEAGFDEIILTSHYIENYCNYINAFTDSISFDELFDNMLNCKPRKNPRKAIMKQIRLTKGRIGK